MSHGLLQRGGRALLALRDTEPPDSRALTNQSKDGAAGLMVLAFTLGLVLISAMWFLLIDILKPLLLREKLRAAHAGLAALGGGGGGGGGFGCGALCRSYFTRLLHRAQTLFYVSASVFLITRAISVYMASYTVADAHTEVLRFSAHVSAEAVGTVTFSVLLFYWLDMYHQRYFRSAHDIGVFSPRVFGGFLATVVLVACQALVLVALSVGGALPLDALVDYTVVETSGLNLLLSLLFLFYGIALLRRARRESDYSRRQMVHMWVVFVATLLFVAAFVLRLAMSVWLLAYQLLPHGTIPAQSSEIAFNLFLYRLPDVAPVLAELYLMQTSYSPRKALVESSFIESLYDRHEQARRDSDDDSSLSAPPSYLGSFASLQAAGLIGGIGDTPMPMPAPLAHDAPYVDAGLATDDE